MAHDKYGSFFCFVISTTKFHLRLWTGVWVDGPPNCDSGVNSDPLTLYCSKPLEPDSIFECLPNTLQPSSEAQGNHSDANPKTATTHTEHHTKAADTAVYKLPVLIPPRILPVLHDLAEQMVQAGNGQDCIIVYRYIYVGCLS